MSKSLPDARNHRPDPAYLLGLLDDAGLSQTEAAKRLGISDRTMRRYLALPERRYSPGEVVTERVPCPYPVQFALEVLATAAKRTKRTDRE